VIKQNNLTT